MEIKCENFWLNRHMEWCVYDTRVCSFREPAIGFTHSSAFGRNAMKSMSIFFSLHFYFEVRLIGKKLNSNRRLERDKIEINIALVFTHHYLTSDVYLLLSMRKYLASMCVDETR